jgi:excisionase family DNA binding protein
MDKLDNSSGGGYRGLAQSARKGGEADLNTRQGLLDVKAAAETLGISRHTLRSWIFRRRIPFVRLGGAIRFNQADLERYVAEHTVPPIVNDRS